MAYLWIFYGIFMDILWHIYGIFMDILWHIYGYYWIDYGFLRTVYGYSLNFYNQKHINI